MATDLAEILTDLNTHATTSSRSDPAAAADARLALSRLRPALDRLHDDGLDTGVLTSADPDAFTRQAERVHWVRLLANTCARLGAATPPSEMPGPMTRLADAAAVTAVLHADVLTGGQRWAIVAGLARTANYLVTAAGGGDQTSPDVDRALIIAEASSGVLFQFAAFDAPTAADYAALHRPVPDPSAEPRSAGAAALEASAALVHATRPGTGPHPIADILAITTAATTVCQFIATARSGDDGVPEPAHDAARAWADVREQLTPFNDGSRRRQTGRPPAVDHALTLHRVFEAAGAVQAEGSPQDWSAVPMGLVLGRLAAVAGRLEASVVDSVAGGRIMAYAVDLQVRESRVRPFLQGHRAPGLVTADSDDFAPARSAVRDAQAKTAALASSTTEPPSRVSSRSGLTEPRRHRPADIQQLVTTRRGGVPQDALAHWPGPDHSDPYPPTSTTVSR